LVGGEGTLASDAPQKTVSSYWPYATTLFDYTRRAMPFDFPGTLSADQVYAVVAYVLHLGGILDEERTLNAATLPAIEMPNRDGFVADPRPDLP
jgi:cytochrome c